LEKGKTMKILLLFLIILLQGNCIGSQGSESPTYLSLAGILQKGEKSTNSVPYGTQPAGLVPTSNGVPASWRNAPNLYSTFQYNLNLIDLLGKFYHRSSTFLEVRQITDFSIVKLDKSLEEPEQVDWDYNTFILDGNMGQILYTIGNHKLNIITDTLLNQAYHISRLYWTISL
jgi:hypothetical protein